MPKTKPISFKAAAKRRREAQAPPPSVPGFERVMPFRDWCALKGFSVLTGQRLRKEGRISEVIASRACETRAKRGRIMSYAIRCLLKSIQSIHSSVSADERAALIAESTEQAKAWVAKSFAQVSRGDEATDEDEEARVEHEDDDDGGGRRR